MSQPFPFPLSSSIIFVSLLSAAESCHQLALGCFVNGQREPSRDTQLRSTVGEPNVSLTVCISNCRVHFVCRTLFFLYPALQTEPRDSRGRIFVGKVFFLVS
jgi:hypothetical protein